ncbi:protein OCTOPUS-like [Phragmites australis]|uniref:protein OCTOPUS-like n=1 Tax=Phragmites australis TaxID=29695 RepID=UPI002D78CCF0|nr:protein OCTOPUS-like [Phragmites australis]
MTLQMEPPVPPPRRSVSTSCDLHPEEIFTGFCAACLRERLAGLEASAAAAATPGRKSTSAIRSLFTRPFAAGGATSGSGAATLPDLRRCRSFSCGRGGDALAAAAGADEPQRRSCDVRGRSTLWALFHQDDRERVRDGTAFGAFPASSSAAAAALAAEVQPHPQPPPPPVCVHEVFLEEEIALAEDSDEITPVVEPVLVVDTSGEMETEANAAREVRAMKDHIDLESFQSQPKKLPPKDLKEIAGSFWLAASVFSKKWQKWRRKQKLKKQEAAGSEAAAAAMPLPEKSSKPSFLRRSRFHRGETGSEFAGGRRSCDTDPRFSLDAGRMSVDDVGFSWDEPRASWDGYLFGAGTGIGPGRAPLPLSRLPPILSALEDSPAGIVERSDGQIPVEDDSQPEPDADANIPGGSAQTRDYYMDSSSRRRRSLDRYNSVRRSFEVTDPKPVAVPAAVTNGKVSPLVGSSEFYHFHHAEDLLDHHRFSTNSLVEDFSASLDATFHDPSKKPRRWRKAWSLWGLIHRRAAGRTNGASDVTDRAFSEPWPELRVRGYNGRMQRCNSNASARSSFSSNSGGLGSSRRSCVDAYGNVKRRREECALDRNRSARYSPGHADNGMLRFYLTPMRSASGRQTGVLPAKGGRQLRSQSFARTMLGLY